MFKYALESVTGNIRRFELLNYCCDFMNASDNWKLIIYSQHTVITAAVSSKNILHLCHVCKLGCQMNYRNDISKHFLSPRHSHSISNNASAKSTIKSKSAAIIWYRYFAR